MCDLIAFEPHFQIARAFVNNKMMPQHEKHKKTRWWYGVQSANLAHEDIIACVEGIRYSRRNSSRIIVVNTWGDLAVGFRVDYDFRRHIYDMDKYVLMV